jgi:hypothetical protein
MKGTTRQLDENRFNNDYLFGVVPCSCREDHRGITAYYNIGILLPIHSPTYIQVHTYQ